MNADAIAKILGKRSTRLGSAGLGVAASGAGLADILASESGGGNPTTQAALSGLAGATLPISLGVKDPKKAALYALASALGLGGLQYGASSFANREQE